MILGGDRVKWKQPNADESAEDRFVVLEVNGDRALVEYICDMPVPPTQLVNVDDIVLAEDTN